MPRPKLTADAVRGELLDLTADVDRQGDVKVLVDMLGARPTWLSLKQNLFLKAIDDFIFAASRARDASAAHLFAPEPPTARAQGWIERARHHGEQVTLTLRLGVLSLDVVVDLESLTRSARGDWSDHPLG